jgi:hypothetical protein
MTPGTLPFAEGNERTGLLLSLQDLRQGTSRHDLPETITLSKSLPVGALEWCTVTLHTPKRNHDCELFSSSA